MKIKFGSVFSVLFGGLLLFGVMSLVTVRSVSADELSQMISPISHPTNFEDPRIITEIRPIFAHHAIQDDFITGGGHVELYALQARFALTDDLAFIATKDGYVDLNPTSVVPDDEGFADIAAGFKYALFQDPDAGQIVTAGLRYEFPIGDEEVLQGQGDGELNPFISAAYAYDSWNFMAASGFRIRMNGDDSSFFDFDLHADYEVCQSFYPFLELGVITVLAPGSRLPEHSEGQDLFNFGSSESDGATLVTLTGGGRYRITEDLDFGAGVQFPLTSNSGSDIIDYRIYSDFIYRFSFS